MNTKNVILLASMREIQEQVDVLHTVSIVCLVLAILLMIAAVVEFFLLDIFQIIQIRTGRAARKGIRRLETETAGSGRLHEKGNKKKNKFWNTAAPLQKAGPTAGAEMPNPAADLNRKNGYAAQGKEETSLLENTGTGDTSLLQNVGSTATTVLEQRQAQYDYSDANITLPLEEEAPVKIGRFVITKNIMMIHTDEVI